MSKITQAIREAFKSVKDRELALPDDVITRLVKVTEDWDDMDDDDKITLLEKTEATASAAAAKISIVNPAISEMVAKIDDAMEAELTELVDTEMKKKVTALFFYSQLRRVYTKSELDSTPYPGTEQEHVSDNEKPDKVKTKDTKGNPITVVFWNDFVSATARGKQYETVMDNVKAEKKTPGSVPSLKGKSKSELASILSDATGRRNALRSIWKRAVSLHHKISAIEAMPLVSIRFIKGTGDKAIELYKFGGKEKITVSACPKPVWISPEDEPGEGRDFSITQVLAFNPKEALAAGGTMANLVETAGRDGDESGDETAMTHDRGLTEITELSAFYAMRDNIAALQKSMNEKDSDDIVDSVCSLYLTLKPLYTKFQARFEKINDMRSEQAEREVA